MKYQNLLITQEEINANSVSSSADILSGTVEENKQVFDNLADVISDKFNNLSNTVQEDFDARYTKEEADAKINEKMIDIGAGDMAASVYDTNHDGVVDNSTKLNNQPANYYAVKEDVIHKSGGTFTGDAIASTKITTEPSIINSVITTSDGTNVAGTSYIKFQRKQVL